MREVPGGVYRIAAGPSDVGSRVSVRRVLRDGREGLGDVVGELVRWSDGSLAVRTRHGDTVEIAEADVVSAKVVPPAPASARRVQQARQAPQARPPSEPS